MTPAGIKKISRIALFAALVYLFSWATAYFPNINLLFFIVFLAGYLWGIYAGVLVGVIGNGLWTFFNPFGPAMVPVMLSQMLGAALVGIIGAVVGNYRIHRFSPLYRSLILIAAAAVVTIGYFIPVNIIDAFIAQPFWARFWAGMLWSLVAVISNLLIFPLLFNLLTNFIVKELESV